MDNEIALLLYWLGILTGIGASILLLVYTLWKGNA